MLCIFCFIKKDYMIVWVEVVVEIVMIRVEWIEWEIILKMKVFEEEIGYYFLNFEKYEIEFVSLELIIYIMDDYEWLVENFLSLLCISVKGKIVYVNSVMFLMLGVKSKGVIIGKWFYEFIEEEYYDIVKNRII